MEILPGTLGRKETESVETLYFGGSGLITKNTRESARNVNVYRS
jgi:hypothetical protein